MPPLPGQSPPDDTSASRFEPPHVYRSVFDNSMDAVLLTAPDGRIAMANRASEEMFGYSADELCRLGRGAVIDSSGPDVTAALEERRRAGRYRGELTMRRKNGTTFPVELSSAIFRDERGDEWTSMFIRDISERKAQEAERARLVGELDAKRRWLEAVLEHVPANVVMFESNGRLSYNRRTEQTLGMDLSPTGGSGQYRARILFRDGTPVAHDQLVSTRVIEHGETITGAEFLVEQPDGTRVPILGAAGPVRDGAGRVIGAIGVFQDVSERMRAEDEIRARERLLDGIFELLPVGVWIADPTGRIVRGNTAGIRIWAGARYVAPSEFDQYRGWWADSGKRIEADEWALARAISKREASIGEIIRIQCFDGTFKTIINSAVPLSDDTGASVGAIVVNEDITRLKETEAALRQAVESRDQVLEVVAHDLKHPLQVILSLVQALGLGTLPDSDDARALRDVESQVGRMNSLIEDLLEAAALESNVFPLQRSRINPQVLLEDVHRAHGRVAAAHGLTLRWEAHPGLHDVSGDQARLLRIFDNLIGNAMKFTPAGGTIALAADEHDGYVRFAVRDTGRGMTQAELDIMFVRRWRADPTAHGLGLGLAIVKAIVEAHGGRIWAESARASGTTVYFTIPSVAP